MTTKRNLAAAALSLSGAMGFAAFTQAPSTAPANAPATTPPPILGPAVFDWNKMVARKTEVGEVRSLHRGPTATVDELEMHITTLLPGKTSHAPHTHLNEELIVIREGECETLSDGKWLRVGPGSVIFNASNSLHGLRNVGTTNATYHVINWSPNKELKAKEAAKGAK